MMPDVLDDISVARLTAVHPQLAAKVKQMAVVLAQEDITFRVTQGLRSWAQQQALYAQGRTAPGKVVTNAPGGHSWHNFGLAVDLAPNLSSAFGGIDPGHFQPDWNLNHPAWQRLVAVGTSLGLQSGKSWQDEPHFQLTGRFGQSPDQEVRQLFEAGGVQAVWDEFAVVGQIPPQAGRARRKVRAADWTPAEPY